MIIEWNKCYFMDCLDEEKGLHSFGTDTFDLGFADPPFNINLPDNKNNGTIFSKKRNDKKKIFYFDNMDFHDYTIWCKKWFDELVRICRKVIIYCGNLNEHIWHTISEPLGKFIWFIPFNTIITKISWAGRYRPLLVYTKDKNTFLGRGEGNNKLFTDVIVKNPKWDLIPNREYIHPCPIDAQLMFDIIEQLEPKSVIDPFLGSGTTAEVCELLGVKWIGYESELKYKNDIDTRVKNGRLKHKWFKQNKLKPVSLTEFIKK